MTHKHIITGLLAVGMLFTAGSCKKFIDPDINIDPNNPSKVSPATLLPSALVAVGYTYGSDFSRFSALITQQVRGRDRQFAAFDVYVYSPQDFDNVWLLNYAAIMKNLQNLIKEAPANKGYSPYGGIARIAMAYVIGTTTDFWGDVPYSQAFGGSENLQPAYDKQQDIYNTVHKLLTDGIAALSNRPTPVGVAEPGNDDVIYGGDIAKWLRLARFLQARFYLHLSKIEPANVQKVIDAITTGGLRDKADDFQVEFGLPANSNNPYYKYMTQRNDIAFDKGFWRDNMLRLKDPRLNVLVNEGGDLSNFYGGQDAPVVLGSFFEQHFILAEAYARQNKWTEAQTAYSAGITASFDKLGIPGAAAAYLTANGTLPADRTEAFKQIMLQKYLAMYLNPEVFTDWRRTNVPALQPINGTRVPRRFLYPQVEISYNAKNVNTKLSVFDKVWWDQ